MGIWQAALVKMGVAQPGPKITAQDRAILDLKLQRDKLKQYQRRLQAVLDREREIAKEALAKGDKRRALLALRQRKYQEQTLVQTDQQLATLQDLVSSIEFTQIQAAVVHGLEQGSAALKTLQAEVNLDRVERIMDESREGIEYQREIDEALASRMSPEEEEEVLRELEALQREQMPAIPEVPTSDPVHLPDAPTKEPTETEPAQEEEPVEAQDTGRVMLAA
ncbi:hypothetical protein CcaverHIS002_0601670 [Cutaneotrichosporon cavernicola]|uniref:Snf7-domain-containing protein n=1 Tax=Cutaneotrichosporon cavernicola TaxID=279322 RepID=A0AA48QWJ8_9TREE|nr:uncharacterized protein CcaverHIS019_0501770 [Cutaneotrichosporon cavernicola]BEI85880.1 hypothetical protein CcaverHIS002_0601670 [Cutaneotrichosporon cavernicola]BEI92549.1 hypothetical protein CcaverHIS019_0501770 [Cutaneotrichosporon cavernicola]BEJ00322.1 hypothetical protein CcaverHIS631_0501790 [Cutaneotrichosporon cavernicola]BEJ08092.1 hypothetical protein CcaverHIS641_0501770 [Cutaneotrichosporon cavernicola]